MKEQLKKLLYKWINNRYDRNEATDAVISLIHEEIEKVKNRHQLLSVYARPAFEQCRQKILSLLGGKDES